jgi:hypothetical protein
LVGSKVAAFIVVPANLVEQWQDEMGERFGLEFFIVTDHDIAPSRIGNPFEERNRFTVTQRARRYCGCRLWGGHRRAGVSPGWGAGGRESVTASPVPLGLTQNRRSVSCGIPPSDAWGGDVCAGGVAGGQDRLGEGRGEEGFAGDIGDHHTGLVGR